MVHDYAAAQRKVEEHARMRTRKASLRKKWIGFFLLVFAILCVGITLIFALQDDMTRQVADPVIETSGNDVTEVASETQPDFTGDEVDLENHAPEIKPFQRDPQNVDYEFYRQLKQPLNITIPRRDFAPDKINVRKSKRCILQAASFRNLGEARRLAENLAPYGFKAKIDSLPSPGDRHWHRVSLGPFGSLSRLNKAQDILVSMDLMALKKCNR